MVRSVIHNAPFPRRVRVIERPFAVDEAVSQHAKWQSLIQHAVSGGQDLVRRRFPVFRRRDYDVSAC